MLQGTSWQRCLLPSTAIHSPCFIMYESMLLFTCDVGRSALPEASLHSQRQIPRRTGLLSVSPIWIKSSLTGCRFLSDSTGVGGQQVQRLHLPCYSALGSAGSKKAVPAVGHIADEQFLWLHLSFQLLRHWRILKVLMTLQSDTTGHCLPMGPRR